MLYSDVDKAYLISTVSNFIVTGNSNVTLVPTSINIILVGLVLLYTLASTIVLVMWR